MKTIFITGHDTNIGKTWITQYIAKKLTQQKQYVQVVKVVETGIKKDQYNSDVSRVLQDLDLNFASGFTLNSFCAPLAPISAAELENKILKLDTIKKQINQLPNTQWRLLEAAGGLSVPLDISGKDGRDLAIELNVDYIILVIANRLGAINQGRLVSSYLSQTYQKNTNVGLWFNDLNSRDNQITQSNFKELSLLHIPIWAHHGFNNLEPDFCYAPFLNL